MVNGPSFFRRGGGGGAGVEDRAPLLEQPDSPPVSNGGVPPRGQSPSAFAAPAQQALGGFDNGTSGLPQSSSASFTFGRVGSMGNFGGAAQLSSAQGHERSLEAPQRSSSFTFGRAPTMGGFQPVPSASSIPQVPGYSFSGGRVIPFAQVPIVPMQPHRSFHAVNVASGPPPPGKSDGSSPKLIKWLNGFSFLVLFICAPLGIFFSYYLWYSTAVLFLGPLASGLAMMAVFFTQWGCCGNTESSIKRMKFLVTLAAVFDVLGAIVTPMVQYGIECPDLEVLNCPYDKPFGQGLSLVAGAVMFVHAILCVITRFRAKHIVTNHFRRGDVGHDLDPPTGFPLAPAYFQYPSYGRIPSGRPPMTATFPSPRNSVRDGQHKPGVPQPPRAVRFV